MNDSEQLARCGYVVAVPRLSGIGGGSPLWSGIGTADLNTALQTHVWVRGHPKITINLAPFPQTGIMVIRTVACWARDWPRSRPAVHSSR